MAGLTKIEPHMFPLQDVAAVVNVFRQQLSDTQQPDLVLLSIVVGAVENALTCNRKFTVEKDTDDDGKLPAVEYRIVDALYTKFLAVVKGAVDVTLYDGKYATRELVKKVSDVIWNSLTRSYYKDRAHLQSLFSYLTGNKLDCFGVAFAVVAGCQVLGYNDVHLALSEDHAWVVFGENGEQSAEVTWHGKGSEDKRGQPVSGGVGSRSWLYVNGHPVVCTREMEVAALVSAINPSLSANTDAIEVALLQQELLWLLFDMNHLSKYPMALGNLGDLEEISPTPHRQFCSELFEKAIQSAQRHYNNQHVYPYTYQAGFFYRHNMYKEAFASWANASDVIRQYNYSRDDEEIYKEFMEIANELIPHIIKVVSSGHSARSILKDPECFAFLLRFYDGICQWEEGSQTPILHIGWAKPLVHTISKFDAAVRAQVIIEESGVADENCNTRDVAVVKPINNNEDACRTRELLRTLEGDCQEDTGISPKIAVLAAACSENILNPRYLIQGGGEPFVKGLISEEESRILRQGGDLLEAGPSREVKEVLPVPDTVPTPRILLHSQKMIGLKDLLLAEKLNTHAISLQLTAQSQSSAIKKVRKSGLPFSFSLSPRDEAPSDTLDSSSSMPKTKRSGGWASETLKSAIRRSSSAFFEQDQLDDRIKVDDDDIPVIPNLDDYDDEVAKAPLVGHKVSTYKELELDLLKHAAFSSLEDVNLRVLTTFLQSEAALDEPDVPWTRATLFSEVLTHLSQGESVDK